MTSDEVEQVIREYIDKTVHMSLATVDGDAPWVCEVHFAYDDSLNLYFRSLTSRRHSQEIAKNPRVAGNIIDNYPLGANVVGVYFEGSAELLKPGSEAFQVAGECLKTRMELTEAIVDETKRPDGHQFYKISVKNWYVFGRFGQPSGKKYKLEWNK